MSHYVFPETPGSHGSLVEFIKGGRERWEHPRASSGEVLAPELERARGTAEEGAACNGADRGRALGLGLGPKIPAQPAPRELPRGRPTVAYLQAWLGLAEGFPEERGAGCEEKFLGLRFFPAAVATTHAASPSHGRSPSPFLPEPGGVPAAAWGSAGPGLGGGGSSRDALRPLRPPVYAPEGPPCRRRHRLPLPKRPRGGGLGAALGHLCARLARLLARFLFSC